MLFEKKDQFTHQMAFAEGMQAIVKSQIAGKEIGHQPALEFGNDADGFDSLFASPQMDR